MYAWVHLGKVVGFGIKRAYKGGRSDLHRAEEGEGEFHCVRCNRGGVLPQDPHGKKSWNFVPQTRWVDEVG